MSATKIRPDLANPRHRVAMDRAVQAEKLARALGLSWDALDKDDRLWWRGESRRLTASPDGVSLLTDWSRLRQPSRLADLLTSAGIAADFIGQIRDAEKEPTP